jgi:hypothetical protein
LAILFGC